MAPLLTQPVTLLVLALIFAANRTSEKTGSHGQVATRWYIDEWYRIWIYLAIAYSTITLLSVLSHARFPFFGAMGSPIHNSPFVIAHAVLILASVATNLQLIRANQHLQIPNAIINHLVDDSPDRVIMQYVHLSGVVSLALFTALSLAGMAYAPLALTVVYGAQLCLSIPLLFAIGNSLRKLGIAWPVWGLLWLYGSAHLAMVYLFFVPDGFPGFFAFAATLKLAVGLTALAIRDELRSKIDSLTANTSYLKLFENHEIRNAMVSPAYRLGALGAAAAFVVFVAAYAISLLHANGGLFGGLRFLEFCAQTLVALLALAALQTLAVGIWFRSARRVMWERIIDMDANVPFSVLPVDLGANNHWAAERLFRRNGTAHNGSLHVVLLNGYLGDGRRSWGLMPSYFLKDADIEDVHVLSYSHGLRSRASVLHQLPLEFAQHLADVFQHDDLPIVVFGHSLGAMIAVQAAHAASVDIDATAQVRALVPRLVRIVCLHSPLSGTRAAFLGFMHDWPRELRPGGGFAVKTSSAVTAILRAGAADGGVAPEIVALVGSRDGIVDGGGLRKLGLSPSRVNGLHSGYNTVYNSEGPQCFELLRQCHVMTQATRNLDGIAQRLHRMRHGGGFGFLFTYGRDGSPGAILKMYGNPGVETGAPDPWDTVCSAFERATRHQRLDAWVSFQTNLRRVLATPAFHGPVARVNWSDSMCALLFRDRQSCLMYVLEDADLKALRETS